MAPKNKARKKKQLITLLLNNAYAVYIYIQKLPITSITDKVKDIQFKL